MLSPPAMPVRPIAVMEHDGMKIDFPSNLLFAHTMDLSVVLQPMSFPQTFLFIQILSPNGNRQLCFHRGVYPSTSLFSDHAAFAGLVDGICSAGIPVRSSWYLS